MSKASQQRDRGKPAFEVMAEATSLVRRAPRHAHVAYLIGTVPFLAGVVRFWSVMSHSPDAHLVLPAGALALAVLYLWMKAWQARYTECLWAALAEEEVPAWGVGAFFRCAARQGVVHVTAVVLAPIALLTLAPMVWVHALYQNCTVLESRESGGVTALFGRAWEEAKRWPRQSYLLAWMLSPLFICFASLLAFLVLPALRGMAEDWVGGMANFYFYLICAACVFCAPSGVVVFLNIRTGIEMVLMVTHLLLGLDTWYSRSPEALDSSTMYVLCACLTYLVLDPVIKAAFTLRCFQAQSLLDGADLRVRLARVRAGAPVVLD